MTALIILGSPHLGDLYEMVYPTGTRTEEDAAYDREFAFSYAGPSAAPRTSSFRRRTRTGAGTCSCSGLLRATCCTPYLADAYGQAAFSRAMPYTMSLLDQTGADTVLIEIVERNLDWWATQGPHFPGPGAGPERRAPPGDGPGPAHRRRRTACWRGTPGWRGRLTGDVDGDSPIYVQLGDMLYEASPVGEAGEGVPFTLYVPAEQAQADTEILYQFEGTALYNRSGFPAINDKFRRIWM